VAIRTEIAPHGGRWLLWTLLATLAAGAIAGLSIALVETDASRAGSLGLLDGRR
jgi:hypothetical protein